MHFIEENSEQQNEYMRVHTNLSEIYADIEGELCSKQSNLMNKLKNKFGSLYSGNFCKNFRSVAISLHCCESCTVFVGLCTFQKFDRRGNKNGQ